MNKVKSSLLGLMIGLGSLISPDNVISDTLNITQTGGIGGGSSFYTKHQSGATEGYLPYDSLYLDPINFTSFEVYSIVDSHVLSRDSRPLNSESVYNAILSTKDSDNLGGYTGDSNMEFTFTTKDATYSNRVYTAKIHLDSSRTYSGQPFDAAFVIPSNGTNVPIPSVSLIHGVPYGSLDVSCRFLTNGVNTRVSKDSSGFNLEAKVQPGANVVPQYTEDLISGNWSNLDSFAQSANVDSNNFNSTPFPYTDPNNGMTYSNASSVTFSNLPSPSSKGFYRLKISK